MIHIQHLPKRAVDIPWEIGNAAAAVLAKENARNVCPWNSRIDLFHRQIRIRRHNGQRRRQGISLRLDIDAIHAIDDSRSILQPVYEWMKLAGSRILFNVEIRILNRVLNLPVKRSPEERGKAEVAPANAPFVVEGGFVRRG